MCSAQVSSDEAAASFLFQDEQLDNNFSSTTQNLPQQGVGGSNSLLVSILAASNSEARNISTNTAAAGAVANPLKCIVCKFTTGSQEFLDKHMLSHSAIRPFACPLCSYCSSRKAHLQQHIRIHTGEKPFKCTFCDYRSNNKSNVKTHEFALHKINQPITDVQLGHQNQWYQWSIKLVFHTSETYYFL